MKGQDDNPFDQQSVEEITAYKLTDGRLVTNLTDAKYEQDKINLLSYVEHLAMGTGMVSSSYEIIVDFFRENYTKLMLVYVQTIARQQRNISQAMEELDGLDENQLFEKIGQEIAKGSPIYYSSPVRPCDKCRNGILENDELCTHCGGKGMRNIMETPIESRVNTALVAAIDKKYDSWPDFYKTNYDNILLDVVDVFKSLLTFNCK